MPVSSTGNAAETATRKAFLGATIGRYAFIGAGAVVRGAIPDYALVVGVPAVQKGWMSRHGHRLRERHAQ